MKENHFERGETYYITNPYSNLQQDRTPLKNAVPVRTTPKLSRNAPCPRGSGRKNKKCCGVAVMPGSE